MLIIYSRCDMFHRLRFLFQLFCYNQRMVMDRNELRFMLSKLSCAIATTLQIKKGQLLDLTEEICEQLIGTDEVAQVTIVDFATKMATILHNFNGRFLL